MKSVADVVDDGKECLCSALAINCFQLGCCLHKSPRCHCDNDNRQWMTRLAASCPDKKLRDVVIPGTHDSGTVTISNYAPFSAVGLTQNVSVYEQLRRGARYLDLRVGGKADSSHVDDTFIIHGMLKGGAFPDVIDEISYFLRENPTEFVIVEVVYDPSKRAMSSDQQLRVLQFLHSTFDKTMITRKDASSWFNLNEVTLKKLQKRNRNVLVLINDKMANFIHDGIHHDLPSIVSDFACHKNEHFMKNRWHNTARAGALLKSNEIFLKDAAKGGCGHLFVNSQFVMTPQPPGGAADVVGMLLGAKSIRPVSLARKLYSKDLLEPFIRDRAESKWNIVLLDFIDLCPQLIKFLIGLNSPKHLRVKQAFVTSNGPVIDVTQAMNRLRSRKNSLYLLNFEDDLQLSTTEGTLSLTVQYDDEEDVDLVIPFKQNTEYLLCDS